MEEEYDEVVKEREVCPAKGSRLVSLKSAGYVRFEIEKKKRRRRKKEEEEKLVVVVIVVKEEQEEKEEKKEEKGSVVFLLRKKRSCRGRRRRRSRTGARNRLGIFHSKGQSKDQIKREEGGGRREGRGRLEGGASAFRMSARYCRDIDDDTSCFEDRLPLSFSTDTKREKAKDGDKDSRS